LLAAPRSWDQISPAWMTKALSPRYPGVVVDRVELDDIDRGTTSRTRAALHYLAGTGPATVWVKAQGSLDHRLLLASLGGVRPEAWLYASGERLPLDIPEAYATAVDSKRLNTILVMEDIVTRGGRPNIATAPLTIAQAGDGLEGLARLHAKYRDRQLPSTLRFLRPWKMNVGWCALAGIGLRGLHRMRRDGSDRILPPAFRYRSVVDFARYAKTTRTGPQTVLHGDAHVGNCYSLPNNTIGFYDWQMVRTGSWAHDVGYFMVSALTVDDRRNADKELLLRYLDALGAAGAKAPSLEDAWTRFRSTPVYGLHLWLQTLAVSSYQSDEVCGSRLTGSPRHTRTSTASKHLTRSDPGHDGGFGHEPDECIAAGGIWALSIGSDCRRRGDRRHSGRICTQHVRSGFPGSAAGGVLYPEQLVDLAETLRSAAAWHQCPRRTSRLRGAHLSFPGGGSFRRTVYRIDPRWRGIH
jgi:hypothetical protein